MDAIMRRRIIAATTIVLALGGRVAQAVVEDQAPVTGSVDPVQNLLYFDGRAASNIGPGEAFQWSSTGFVSGPQFLFPANMAALGGVPNDDGTVGLSFIEIDASNSAVNLVLAFNFPEGVSAGEFVGNPGVKFDYSVFSISEQQVLESLAIANTLLTMQDGTEAIQLVSVPEPSPLVLVGLSVIGWCGLRRRKSGPAVKSSTAW